MGILWAHTGAIGCIVLSYQLHTHTPTHLVLCLGACGHLAVVRGKVDLEDLVIVGVLVPPQLLSCPLLPRGRQTVWSAQGDQLVGEGRGREGGGREGYYSCSLVPRL